ncbi:MAG TPA: S8 family serine peptidase [Pirellulaceae bacterium]|nr:S8 family serine peptidase [Pirellulaceae bacterium]
MFQGSRSYLSRVHNWLQSSKRRSLSTNRRFRTFEMLENRCLLAADFVDGQLLIQFQAHASDQAKAAAFGQIGAALQENIHTPAMKEAGAGELSLVTLPRGSGIQEAIERLKNHPAVQYAEPNWIFHPQATSNDPYYTQGYLWGTYGDATSPANAFGSQAGEAWAAGNVGHSSIVVGIIDEGIDFSHPDLAANMWRNPGEIAGDGIDNDGNGYIDDIYGWDFHNNDNSVYDGTSSNTVDDHGTHVAGTIGGVGGNGQGVAGVAWQTQMIAAKFLGPDGGYLSNAIKALDYLTTLKTKYGVNVIASNNSWGGGGYSSSLESAIVRGAKAGILFVAAAGNSGDNNDTKASYPSNYNTTAGAGYDAVIAVAAIDKYGSLASFSNYGSTTVDVGAPGVGIYSTLPNNTYGGYSGTSMATPHVTGALVLYAAANPGASAEAIRSAVLTAAQNTPTASLAGATATGGRLNVSNMVAQQPGLSINDVSVVEGNSGTAALTFTITLSSASSQTVSVQYATADGSATAGSDYAAASGTLSFAAGVTSQTITVSVLGDTVNEGNETFFVNLSTAVNAAIADSQGLGTILNDDVPPTGFYVVDNGSSDRTYEYGASGAALENHATASGNTAPRGVASTAAGDKFWVVDANKKVYVYDASGGLLGSWTAGSLSSTAALHGITTNGTDVWIVDTKSDKIFKYAGAADRLSGSQSAASSFKLNSGNVTAKGLVTDGTSIWVANNTSSTDKVFKYTVGGSLLGSWTISSGGTSPTGITIDPANVSNIWIVDNYTDRVYQFDGAAGRTSGSQSPTSSFALAAGNTNPQGISQMLTQAPESLEPALSINDVSIVEGNSGSAGLTFTVTLSAASSQTVSVHYATADGSAAAGSDYTAASGTLSFAAGVTSRTITVSVLGDTVSEGNETFFVNLSTAVNAAIADGQGVGTILDDDVQATKFYVVDNGSSDRTYEYGASGAAIENYATASGNTAPRGAASTAAGDKVWVVDANKSVYVYDASGGLLGSWTAGSLPSTSALHGITTNGTDVWIVDAYSDKVFKYAGAADRLSGSQTAASSFNLNSGNLGPKGLTTDGTSIWVVNNTSTADKVFKYTVGGSLLGSWTISSGGSSPTGITIDPANVSNIWIVDNYTDRVYQYDAAAGRTSGSQSPTSSFALAAGNTNPQGIADPPPPVSSEAAAIDYALLALLSEFDSWDASLKRRR